MKARDILLITALAANAPARNPFITHIYTADPSARVFGDVLYVYPSHDRDHAQWWDMEDYHVFSTTNMVHWTDHGRALDIADIPWAQKHAWAPDCMERDGRYYFYFPTDQAHIGVAVGGTPWGPFKDALGKPLLSKHSEGVVCRRDFIDPCVFIDNDGQAYLFAGQLDLNAVKLGRDMVSIDGPVRQIEGLDHFFEAAWIHVREGRYYLSYSGQGRILYAVSDQVLGPYEFKGTILGKVNSGTNHHSIVKYKGRWYLFYHTADLSMQRNPKGSPEAKYSQWRRSICVDELAYHEDGSIQEVVPTLEGVAPAAAPADLAP